MQTETKTTFTPGPWTIPNEEVEVLVIVGSDGTAIFNAYRDTTNAVGDERLMANARLIAAAPELLGLLQRLRQWDHLNGVADGPYWQAEIDTAIAKATGAPA